ncbi:MFS transporter [Kribbella jejuensis]|uniref:Putative MFS family arabinose efflux permease n=1 Tax=Kribbella jejuensis TaxID=236068 RepID=A0A542ERC2_9ACTN|nr:MFS transporter [Kribbella jejuensis]TQJ17907.1 putative MFS family arabinose efflux permease [Kribbella jejuensis]
MTTACETTTALVTDRLLDARFVRLLAMVFGSGLSIYLLTSVVPLYLAANGAGGIGAGLSTAATMFSAVSVELLITRMLARWGYQLVLGLGLVLLGAPSLILLATAALPLVLAVCIVRGAGLAILVVGAVALIADLTPPTRRSEALGVYGVAVGIPAVIGLPLGVYLGHVIGFDALFVLAAVTSLAGLVMLIGLPATAGTEEQHVQVLGGVRRSGLLMPSLVFAAVTVAAGISVTFLPLAVAPSKQSMVATALLLQAIAAPLARWLAGRYADRIGAAKLLAPVLVLAAIGAGSLVFLPSPVAILIGSVCFGSGFGAAQNLTLSLMYNRVDRSRYGQVSALWNLAYDGGWGLGAIVFGLVVSGVGYPAAFAMTAAVVAVAVLPAVKASA